MPRRSAVGLAVLTASPVFFEPAPVHACAGACPTDMGPLLAVLLAAAGGLWLLARAAVWWRDRARRRAASRDDPGALDDPPF